MARRKTEVFGLSFLDCICCGFGATILIYMVLNSGAKDRAAPGQRVEIEVTNLDELDEAIAAGADMVLLDNFVDRDGDVSLLQAAVDRADERVMLEASGGVTHETLAAIARTGVHYASLGALTHSAGSLDFSLEVVL